MKLPSYPKYKDSGVEWLGEVPEHWDISRFSRSVHIAEGQVNPEIEPYSEMILIAPNHIESGTGRLLTMETASEQGAESGKYVCKPGDVVYSKIRPALAKAVIAPEHCLCSADMYPLRGNSSLNNKFIFWTLLSKWFTAWSILESDRVAMPKINRETLGGCLLCAPPVPEQHAIAAFLDAQTAKIDTLIAKKRELIDKLKEKRAALITRTVTRGLPPEAAKAAGLDPNPRMKDSGVEWLGEVPEHWGVSQLKYEIQPGTSITYGIVQAGPDVEDGVPYIRTSDMSGEFFKEDGYPKTSHEIDNSYRRSRVYEGDVVVAIRATVGKALPVPSHLNGANLTQGTAKISPGRRLMTDYLLHYLASTAATQRFNSLAKGATFKEITLEMLRNFTIPIPPLTEQQQITSHVNSKLHQLSTTLNCTEAAIGALQEYRSALITAAVTGKIDVREAV